MTKKFLTKIFVIEDDEIFSRVLKMRLEKEDDFEVVVFNNGEEFLAQLHQNPDIVIVDHNLPGMSGLEILKQVNIYNKQIPAIILSGQENIEVVVEAYRNGAKDYIIKNANALIDLTSSIRNFSMQVNLRKEVEDLRSLIIDRSKYSDIIGESKPILSVIRLLQKVEKTNMMVLVTGESGTGKEVVSRVVHYNSSRRREPFVPVNMAAIPEELIESELFGHEKGSFTGAETRRIGKFEEANYGTIFLDEIGEMDLHLQTKLLRVLQENTICRVGSNKEIKLDVRVVAATNKNLGQLVKDGKFREDLFYRLQGFLIHLPPLRGRGNDIILLAKYFLQDFCTRNKMKVKSLSRNACENLLDYNWPGNVRELKSVMERAVVISDEEQISTEDLIFSSVVC